MVEVLTAAYHFQSLNFPINIFRIPYNMGERILHRHEFAELAVILGGRAVHFTEEDSYPIEAGDIFFLQGDVIHGFHEMNDLYIVNIIFRPESLNIPWHYLRTLPGYHALFALEPRYRRQHGFMSRLHVGPDELAEIDALLLHMETELEQCNAGYEVVVLASFGHLLVKLARCYSRMTMPTAVEVMRIGEALSQMETRYMDEFSLEELAASAFMSTSTFLRTFKKAMGISPIAYLIHLRIRKAVELLHESSASITEIAGEVGFSDSNYFARQFTAIMGISPRAYRQRMSLIPRAPRRSPF